MISITKLVKTEKIDSNYIQCTQQKQVKKTIVKDLSWLRRKVLAG
jgi:hypothetical protein